MDNKAHYDGVTEAWKYILGDNWLSDFSQKLSSILVISYKSKIDKNT